MSGERVIRKAVRNLSEEEVSNLRSAYRHMKEIGDNRSYGYLAGHHGVPDWYCWHHQRVSGIYQGVRLFLPWHRAYLYRFEQAAQDQVPRVAIPWWDWRSEKSHTEGIPKIFTDDTVNGEANPLFKAHISAPSSVRADGRKFPPYDEDTVRFPNAPSELPDYNEVEELLQLTDYGDFNDGLENIHDGIHMWVNGSMGSVATAAFDPIFWSHHCMVDRIWWLWQLQHGNSGIPPNLLDEVLAPFNLRVRDVLNIYDLGYDYAGTVVSAVFEGG